MNERRWFLACAIVVLAACGDDPVTPMDDGGTPPTDAGAPTPPPLAMADTDGDPDNGAEAPANWGCIGSETAPSAGEPLSFPAHFYDFQTPENDVATTPVQVFTTNVVAAACAAPDCAMYTTDAAGDATLTAPAGGWLAYRVPTTETYFSTIGYNRAAPSVATDTLSLPVVSAFTVQAILAIFRRTRVPTTGVVSGNLSDCDGNTVEGAQLRLFRGDSEIIPGTGASDFFVGYIEGGIPDRTARWTFPHGIYASANVPSGAEPVRVELWAVTTEGSDPVRVACEAIAVESDAISIISTGPTRNDYPAGHPCAE